MEADRHRFFILDIGYAEDLEQSPMDRPFTFLANSYVSPSKGFYSETVVTTWQTAQCHNPDDHSINLLLSLIPTVSIGHPTMERLSKLS
jgi:hypothetical protein